MKSTSSFVAHRRHHNVSNLLEIYITPTPSFMIECEDLEKIRDGI